MKDKNIITNAPNSKKIGPATVLNTKDPYHSDRIYPGDSVDEHKKIENANMFLNEGALGQINENS
ncbi:hypothetical protein ACFDTO_23440 [Microbacteriaceae bacterium 4G12]